MSLWPHGTREGLNYERLIPDVEFGTSAPRVVTSSFPSLEFVDTPVIDTSRTVGT